MTKPGPKPQLPLWKQSRPLAAVGGGLVGLLALIAGAQQLFFSGGSDTSPQRMEQWIDDYLDREAKETTAQRHAEVEKRIRMLVEVTSAPGFSKVPKEKQDAIRNRHRELRDYQEYEQALEKIDDPRSARTEEQLRKIRDQLVAVHVPANYLTEWTGTPAHNRHNERLADLTALDRAVADLVYQYQTLTRDGRHELANAAAANLPTRARQVLERARTVPLPSTHQATLLPGSQRLTYAAVFAFTSVTEAQAEWQVIRKKLEGVAGLKKP